MPQRINTLINFLNEVKLEIIAFLVALCVPIIPGLMLIGLLIFADTFTGIWKSVKGKGWDSWKSKIMKEGILEKIIMYPLALLIGSGCEYIFPEIPFIKSSIFLLMCIEIKSLVENFNEILGINLFIYIKTFILKGRREVINEMLKSKEDEGK